MNTEEILKMTKRAQLLHFAAGVALFFLAFIEGFFQTHSIFIVALAAFISMSFYACSSDVKYTECLLRGIDSRDKQIQNLKDMVVGE